MSCDVPQGKHRSLSYRHLLGVFMRPPPKLRHPFSSELHPLIKRNFVLLKLVQIGKQQTVRRNDGDAPISCDLWLVHVRIPGINLMF